MIDANSPGPPADPAEAALRQGLVRGDAVLGSVGPVLRHLLVHDDRHLFTEDVLARMKGMHADLARQLALALGGGDDRAAPESADPVVLAALEQLLYAVPGLLGHLHATAIEWQVTEGLHVRLGLDPVLSPLVQALVASPDGETGAAAMKMLAAQARFAQYQRQMRMPLAELPADLLHGVLSALTTLTGHDHDDATAAAIRARYDESTTRLGLLARLVTGMGAGAIAALSLGHGGLALFTTTMALACDMPRELCVLATQEGQAARLALELRAAGLKPATIEENLLALHPEANSPWGIAQVTPESAAALLAAAPLGAGIDAHVMAVA